MQGIEISKLFFEQYGMPMLQAEFNHILPLLAIGLCGSGSECYGYDDEISRDHDFEAGFCIFVPESIDRKVEFQLKRAYNKLPKEFMGIKRGIVSPVGGNRHGVIYTARFFTEKTGSPNGCLSLSDWFNVPEFSLLEATNGEIFIDNLGEITEIRQKLSKMPQDVKLKKLAAHLLNMGQAGQYNYNRCIRRNETGGAQLAAVEFVKSALNTIFLINDCYMPYYKWCFHALCELPRLSDLAIPLEFIISSDNTPDNASLKSGLIEDIAFNIIKELKDDGITKAVCNDLEKHAYSVNDQIENTSLRNEHILFAL